MNRYFVGLRSALVPGMAADGHPGLVIGMAAGYLHPGS